MSTTTHVNEIPRIVVSGIKTSYRRADATVVSVFNVTNIGYAIFDGNELVFLSDEYEQIQDWIMADLGLLN
jgi:hypothetical protein